MARRGPQPGTVIPRPPHDIIRDGKGAVGVLLSNRPSRVWVDLADFSRIVGMYGNRAWSWVEAKRYARLKTGACSEIPIARLVVGERGRFIRYGDGDRLNLRRANLRVEEAVRPGGRAKREVSVPRAGTSRLVKMQTPTTRSPPPASPQRKVVVPKATILAVATVKRCR